MRGRIGILPIVLFGVGCAPLRPFTPSVSVAFWAEDVPDARDYAMPSTADLSQRWQVPPETSWARYQKTTLLSAADPLGPQASLPDVVRLDVVNSASAAASHVGQIGLPAGTLWIVDLRGAASAAFVARLSWAAREPIVPILTFNNWPDDHELVPADETLAGLVAFRPRLPPPDAQILAAAHPVFALDSWRLAYRFDQPEDDVYDNRYMLNPSDFPDADTLRARGITRVIYVVEDLDDTEVEEDDLHATFRAWQASGVGIHIVDLAFLKGVPPPIAGAGPRDWAGILAPRTYWAGDRYTLVEDPVFYARARAGFGLAWSRPFIYGHGGGSGHGGSGGHFGSFGHGGGG